jgi:hypothetical protein
MKHTVYIYALAPVLFLASCTDILDTAPYGKAASATMWTTENLTDMGIAALYANLRDWGPYNGTLTKGVGPYGFESLGVTGQHAYTQSVTNGTATPGSGLFSSTWKKLYEGVHRANDAIANIPVKSPVSAEKKGRLVAEAKFLRAFHYYRLNELFHGVPIYTEPVDEADCIKTQSTEEEVWQLIIDDLTDCIDEPNFPDNDFSQGRATKGAAYALRGKTYLRRKEWQKAADDFAAVGTCGYSLFSGGYRELFLEQNERSAEMIFSVQNVAETDYGSWSLQYCGTRSAGVAGANGWGDYQVHPFAVDLHENADGTPFNWDDIIPDYTTMTPDEREVYFLRDTLDANGQAIEPRVTIAVGNRLKAIAEAVGEDVAGRYLPFGNEARIRQAYIGRDPRLEMNVITPYAVFRGFDGGSNEFYNTARWPFVGNQANTGLGDLQPNVTNLFYYFHRKFVYEGNNPVPRQACPTDDPLIRYADVLLLWAEALCELNQLSEAADKVNAVRARPSVEMPPVAYASQDELRQKIRNERRIEFLNEGVNFFDEMRWRTLKETKYAPGAAAQQVWGKAAAGGIYVWPNGNDLYVWPVPQAEVEKNPNLLHTPGWQY